MYILTAEFMKLVVVSIVVAIPLAYWAMSTWLTSYAYRIEMGFGTLLFAAAISLFIAMITVGYQAHRASRTDPVQALRYD